MLEPYDGKLSRTVLRREGDREISDLSDLQNWKNMSMLHLWKTPFDSKTDSSIGIYLEHGKDETDLITAIVAPSGIGSYPKYLVHFRECIEFHCYEESFSPERACLSVEVDQKGFCSYIWHDSPSVKAYEKGIPFIAPKLKGKFKHYVLFGGDNILEVVTQNTPEIETIFESQEINIKLAV